MNKIPFCEPNLGNLEQEYLLDAYRSGWIGGKGDYIDKFEAAFAKYIGVDYAVTCSSGTSALMLTYHAVGMQSGNKVFAPWNTFVATGNMVKLFTHDLQQRLVNDETWTLNLNEEEYDNSIVVGVHLYGNPCDMGLVYKKRYIFIEDVAQGLGSSFKGKKCGSFGLASIFSFHSAKTITTGEGGMVCTSNKLLAQRVRHLKNQSMVRPYEHTGIGYNARMTNLQAAVGLAQLERIDELISNKKEMTKFYDDNLDKAFIRQKPQRKSDVVKWANAYKHPAATHIRNELELAGIDTRPGFIDKDIIVLPCSTTLTKDQQAIIVHEMNKNVQ